MSSTWRFLLWFAAVACTGAAPGAADTRSARAIGTDGRGQAASVATPKDGGARGLRRSIGFRSPRFLDEHYAKHGREFGDIGKAEYLRRAQALRDAAPGPDILEVVRADGTISRFERSTGSFLAFNRDGTIRTFFRPNDGEAYFRRQARRRPGP